MGKFDKKSVAARGGAKSSPQVKHKPVADVSSNPEFRKIAPWLASVKFQKKAVGGLDPVDVWNKIEELNAMYERAIMAERVRCDMLIEQLNRKIAEDSVYEPSVEDELDG